MSDDIRRVITEIEDEIKRRLGETRLDLNIVCIFAWPDHVEHTARCSVMTSASTKAQFDLIMRLAMSGADNNLPPEQRH